MELAAVQSRLKGLHPRTIDLDLERVERLLLRCGSPERSLPRVVHVAGTNGKGSTVAMLRAGLEGTGHRVHAYTSPHLVHMTESFCVGSRLLSRAELTALLREVEGINAGAPVTFYEAATAAAFLSFARAPADFTLVEVGMGGRLDATNAAALAPEVCVITPVSLDHQSFLGDTVGKVN